jgi:hypothetical protein
MLEATLKENPVRPPAGAETPEPFIIHRSDSHSSGVSWSAVIAGAFVMAALSLILLALGAGFGLSAVSPWSNVGASASSVGSVAIVWIILTEMMASALGGYLAGRLRSRWHAIHSDEVHFRDTANGFLAWAVAVVITVTFLASAATSMVGGITRSDQAPPSPADSYFVDTLFRSDRAATGEDRQARSEAGRALAHALVHTGASPVDAARLAQLVSANTGLAPNDAEKRVSDTIADARRTEDNARQATAHLLLWIFLALLMGAFSASYAATIGGRQRDHVRTV